MSETKSEELEVRSEELIKQLRHCAASSLQGCDTCPQRIEPDCMTIMLLSAADEIEKLTGYDFFSALDDETENQAEATVTISRWPFTPR